MKNPICPRHNIELTLDPNQDAKLWLTDGADKAYFCKQCFNDSENFKIEHPDYLELSNTEKASHRSFQWCVGKTGILYYFYARWIDSGFRVKEGRPNPAFKFR